MAVAYVAYQYLGPQTKARAGELIRLNPLYGTWKKQLRSGLSARQRNMMFFMIAATWPDQIRGDHSYHPGRHAAGKSSERQPQIEQHCRDQFLDYDFGRS